MAAEGLYYPDLTLSYPDPHEEVDKADAQECSVRGCHRSIESNGQNKMCDECRGRHRGYATTKRLRRKLEKAALQAMGVSGEAPIVPMDIQSWDPTIDPMLYDVSRQASTSTPGPSISLSSSTSELANALTLPTHFYQQEQLPEHVSSQFQENVPSQEGHGAATCISPAMLQGVSVDSTPAPAPAPVTPVPDASTSSEGARFCSVKGCKAVIPGSYEYKMCPSCRTRYRGYGITKRTKWKNEREAFEREMTQLRAAEDERRKANGEPPLADDPVAQKEWEITILDEEIALPPPILAALKAAGVNADGTLEAGSSALSLYQNEPGQPSAIDTPHAIAPYPSVLGSIPQLPARMCTVSHCHQILPGYYRYKRCEQHRLQNRHHSKLKRVREKEEKAMGPKEGAAIVDIPPEAAEPKKKGKAAEKQSAFTSEEALLSDSGNEEIAEKEAQTKKKKKKGRKVTHCVSEGCGKALPEDKRWKNCDECRAEERRKKLRAKTNARLNKNSPPTEQVSTEVPEAEPTTMMVTDDPVVESNAATQPLKLVNLTADTFETPEPAFRWANETTAILVDSSAAIDLARPALNPQQPLTIRHYRPPKNTDKSGSRASGSQPYVIVEQFPFTGERSRRPYERPVVNQIHVAPVTENAMPATAHKPYPNAGVFRHYIPVEEKEPEPPSRPPAIAVVTSASVSPPMPSGLSPEAPEQGNNLAPPSASAVQAAAPTAAGKTASKAKPKSKGKEKAVEVLSAPSPPVVNPVPQLFPYPPFPVHPYFYLPPQYNPNAPPTTYAYPGYPPTTVPSASGESAIPALNEGGSGGAGASASAPPQGLLPVPYPYPFVHPQPAGMPYAYPASVSAPVPHGAPAGAVPFPYFYPPYPYSASAPPIPGFAGAPLSAPVLPVPTGSNSTGVQGPSVSAPPANAAPSSGAESAGVPVPASGQSVSANAPKPARPPKEPKEPKETKFSYYHHGYGSTDSPDAPTGSADGTKKRRKIDPAWLEKMRLRAEQEKQQQNEAASSSTRMNPWAGSEILATQTTTVAGPSQAVAAPEQAPGIPMDADPPVGQSSSTSPKPTAPLVQHPCSNKTCKRRVTSVSGTALCDKCKAKFKKHAEKNKRKHKLVPVKPVSAMSVGVSLDIGRS